MSDAVEQFTPPPGPPPPKKHKTTYATEVARDLRPQGWSVLNLSDHPHHTFGHDRTYTEHSEVAGAIDDLFTASKAFFALPSSDKEKFDLKNADGSEEGFSAIKGEKEFITLRRNDAAHCPEILRPAVEHAWAAVFSMLNEGLGGVENDLGLPATSLSRFAEPCLKMDARARATMMRLFRYENDEAKIVAEPHNDLGLLSLVIGDTPGLEVLDHNITADDGTNPCWHPIERGFERGMATLMSGRQLQYLTRDRYVPGGHRVVSYGPDTALIPANLDDLYPSRSKRILNRLSFSKPKEPMKEKYRYSIVFVLRAHEAVPVDYSLLESPGFIFDVKDKEARTAGELFKRIKKAHYNVNIGHAQREEQKKKIMESSNGNKDSQETQKNGMATGRQHRNVR